MLLVLRCQADAHKAKLHSLDRAGGANEWVCSGLGGLSSLQWEQGRLTQRSAGDKDCSGGRC